MGQLKRCMSLRTCDGGFSLDGRCVCVCSLHVRIASEYINVAIYHRLDRKWKRMSSISSRARYALYLIARPFHRGRNSSEREVIALAEVPPSQAVGGSVYQADEAVDLSSLESVPVEETQTTIPSQPVIPRGTLRMEGASSVMSNIRDSLHHFMGRLQLLLPWAEDGEAEAVPGDDPTFQQLLMLSGLFCGPVMFFIGRTSCRSHQAAYMQMALLKTITNIATQVACCSALCRENTLVPGRYLS